MIRIKRYNVYTFYEKYSKWKTWSWILAIFIRFRYNTKLKFSQPAQYFIFNLKRTIFSNFN